MMTHFFGCVYIDSVFMVNCNYIDSK